MYKLLYRLCRMVLVLLLLILFLLALVDVVADNAQDTFVIVDAIVVG